MRSSLRPFAKGVRMLKWPNVKRVFRWEFLKNLRSPLFVVTTLMIPLIMLLSVGISYYAGTRTTQAKLDVAVIDETGELFPYLESAFSSTSVTLSLSEPAQQERLSGQVEEGELSGYLIFTPENVQTGVIDYYVLSANDVNVGLLDRPVKTALTSYRLEKMGLTVEEIGLATAPMVLQPRSISGEGISIVGAIAPFVVSIILLIAVMTSGQVLMYGVLKEKRNRIVEILLSSVSAVDLLLGKILGLGLLGVLQIGIWMVVGLVAASRFIDLSQLGMTAGAILPMLLFLIGGYIMFAALFAAIGATMKSVEEGSQAQSTVRRSHPDDPNVCFQRDHHVAQCALGADLQSYTGLHASDDADAPLGYDRAGVGDSNYFCRFDVGVGFLCHIRRTHLQPWSAAIRSDALF